MGCYYGKSSSDLSEEEKGTFRTSLRGSLDFYKSLLKTHGLQALLCVWAVYIINQK